MMEKSLYIVLIIAALCVPGAIYAQNVNSIDEVEADPTATIVGTDTELCLGDSVAAYIIFTGGGPWDAIINDNSGEYLKLKDVESPYTIWLKPVTDDRYYISYVEDKRRNDGKTYGEVIVSVFEPTPVSILLDRKAYLQTEPGIPLEATFSGGVFIGNGVAGNSFYPGFATPVGSPHNITYTYTNPQGCISSDNIDLYVLYGEGEVHLLSGSDTINELCDNGETYEIRGSSLDDIPGLFELREADSELPVPGHILDEDPLDDMAILDPTGITGLYNIIYTYEILGLSVSIPYSFLVKDLGTIEIPGLPAAVCKNDDPYPLVAQLLDSYPEDVYAFSGPGVSGNQEEGYYYDPGDPDAPVGENQIDLVYNSFNGCSASYAWVVSNRYVPDVQFSLAPICLTDGKGLVTFENLTDGKFAVDSWSWNFGDPSSGSENQSSLENPEHFYEEAGSRQISLTATTSEGCVALHLMDTVLIDQPLADFSWINDCFIEGQKIAFVDRSRSIYSPLDTLRWTFKTSSGLVLGAIESYSPDDTVEFLFNSMEGYLINLQIRNEQGCQDNVSKEMILNPIRILTTEGYEEDFNGEKSDWFSGSVSQSHSWKRGVPDFTGFNQVPDDLAWYTDLPPENSGDPEYSWIQSVCFDFSSWKSPFIQLDLMKSFTPGEDGAVLQYQDEVSEGWKTIGYLEDGINWYNVSGLLNKPGGSNTAWGLNQFVPDTKWVNASHNLNMLAGLSHVKFRVSIATGGSQEIEPGQYNQGFAFDNIFFGELVRTTLLEYFTNSSTTESRDADDVVDRFAKSHFGSVIDLQYHTDYPGMDLMNMNNPYPPSARSFHYGIQGVPYALMNGGSKPDHRFDFSDPSNEPNSGILQQVSMEAPVFDMDLTVNWLENSLEATTLLTCRTDTFNSYLQLYVALIETTISAYTGLNQDTLFRNVVLDMLPTAAGKLLGNEWYSGKTASKTYLWDYKEYIEDVEDLAVVAFVQDRDNGQILQVAINYLSPHMGTLATSKGSGSLSIYPNPALDRLFVNLGSRHVKSGQVKIMDLSGKEILRVDVLPGFSVYQLDVAHISRGMYMIYWVESGTLKGYTKLVLTR